MCGTSTRSVNAFQVKTLCPLPASPAEVLMIFPSFFLQVPLAHSIFGLIGPNAGLGFAIGKKCSQRQEEAPERWRWWAALPPPVLIEEVGGKAEGAGEQRPGHRERGS